MPRGWGRPWDGSPKVSCHSQCQPRVLCPSDYGVHGATTPSGPPSHPQELGIGVATVPRGGCSVPEVTVLSWDTLGGPGLAVLSQKWPWCPSVGCGVPGMAAVPKAKQISRAGYSQGYLCCPGSSHSAQGTAGMSQGGFRMWEPGMGRSRKSKVTETGIPQPCWKHFGTDAGPKCHPTLCGTQTMSPATASSVSPLAQDLAAHPCNLSSHVPSQANSCTGMSPARPPGPSRHT